MAFVLAFAAGMMLRLRNARADLFELFQTSLFDDTFYYLGIAHHLALGDPPSIDGVTPTNGFHPLWVALLLPSFWLSAPLDLITPIRVALLAGALFDGLSALWLWRISGALGIRSWPRVLGVSWYLLNPFQVWNATNGLETSLALCAALGLLCLHVETSARPYLRLRWLPVGFGVLAGLVMLARSDYAIVVACLYGARLLRVAAEERALLRRWVISPLLAMGLLQAPWIAYSLVTTGAVVQSSAWALTTVVGRLPEAYGMDPGLGVRLGQGVAVLGYALDIIAEFHALPVWALLVLWAVPASMLGGPWRRRLLGRLQPLMPWFVGVLVLLLVHTFGRLVYTGWYNAPYVATTALLMAAILDALGRRSRSHWAAAGLATALVAGWLAGAHLAWRARASSMEPERGLPRPFELAGRRGSTDCGRNSYFHVVGVTNLDGVVNPQAHDALRARRLLDYVRAEGLRSFYATYYFHSDVFFGEGYREQVVTVEGHPAHVRLATPSEKDAAIALGRDPLSLGTTAGRNLLGHGWEWHATDQGAVRSIGERSELLFSLRGPPRQAATVWLLLQAEVVDGAARQPVDVSLDGIRRVTWSVRQELAWYAVPAGRLGAGRHRITLRYGAARQCAEPGMFADFGVRPVRAVRIQALRLR